MLKYLYNKSKNYDNIHLTCDFHKKERKTRKISVKNKRKYKTKKTYGVTMRETVFKEKKSHGAPDFPVQLYRIDKSHPRYEMTLHWHREIELVRVKAGSLRLYVNQKKYTLRAGDVAFIGSRDMHRAEPKNAVYECLVFDLNMLSRGGTDRLSRYVMPLFSDNTYMSCAVSEGQSPLVRSANELFECMGGEEEFFELRAHSLISEVVYLLYKENKIRSKKKNALTSHKREMISSLIKWIEKNYTEKITLSDLAGVVNINEKYLCRFFKEYTGKSPVDYINRLRLDRACEMLIDGTSVTETALCCGFVDMSYFSKMFKRHKGVTPRQYRFITVKGTKG